MTRNFIALAVVTAVAGCGTPASNTMNAASNATSPNGMVAPGEAGGNFMSAPNAMSNMAAAPITATPIDAAGYIASAGAGDMFEIESSKALLARSTSADAKRFANEMIDAHTKSTAKIKAAAKEAGLTVSTPTLDTMQQQMLDEIKAAPTDRIDAVYFADQSKAHAAALALHEHYAANGDTPALKKAASEIAPVVRQHIAEIEKLRPK